MMLRRCATVAAHRGVRWPTQVPRMCRGKASDAHSALQEAYDDDLMEVEETEEHLLPPWRQLKPWRWEPEEDELGWLRFIQLPKVQEEKGLLHSYITGAACTFIMIFFPFVWWGPPEARAYFKIRRNSPDAELT
mmetsp:Transcript_89668/g.159280  ORF Transcript_89668/g.159280 Transcript_89668/m.159280 type:complete len:134 (+) Transcript_89668:32-433(+)